MTTPAYAKIPVTHADLVALPVVRPNAHPICYNHTDIDPARNPNKWSRDIWAHVIQRVIKNSGSDRFKLPASPTKDDRRRLTLAKHQMHARAMSHLRILMVADSEIGQPCLATGGKLYFALDKTIDAEDNLLKGFTGSAVTHPARWHGRRFSTDEQGTGVPYLDVTSTFWDQYLLFGRCAKSESGFREVNHNWEMVTKTSKRCTCCGMWSYRRRQRTVVEHARYKESKVRQERTIRQLPVWEHQQSHLHANPYFELVRQLEDE